MSQDYNIYLHTEKSVKSPTQPKNIKSKTSPWSNDDEKETLMDFKSFKSEAVSQIPIIGKIGATAMAIYAGTRVTISAIDKISSYQAAETGRHSFYTQFTNFQKTISNIFNPIQSVENYLRATQAERLTTMRNNEQMKLLGDSVWNRTTRRV